MAENTIDTLSIEISSDSSAASHSIDALVSSLSRLGAATKNLRLNATANGLKNIAEASNKLETGKLTDFARSLQSLSNSISNIAGLAGQVAPALRNLERLGSLNLSGLQLTGDFSGLASLSRGIRDFAAAVPGLAAINPTQINQVFRSLNRLGSINLSGLASSLQAFNQVDFSAFNRLGIAFQAFASSLANSDRIPAAIGKVFNSLAQLASSAANIPIVTANLPPLTEQVQRFISAMSTSAAVDAGTVSLVGALSGLANAGAKAQKTAAALPQITQGVKDFAASMATMPPLNDNIVRVVDSLSRLSNAGGVAGNVARNLQANVSSLSVSMTGLSGGVGRAVKGLKSFSGQILALLGIGSGLYGLVTVIKKSVTAASDLSEAENVVEQGFGDLIYKIEDFSKTSIQAFGMSELAAKNTAGIYAAMTKSLGVLPDVATDMAVSLTGLTGDLASFYNVSQDVASTALKSIFTGETESLKRLGIVMTQANLQAFALSQGITKSVKSMTQAELVTLRYNYVMDAASAAVGDFSRTASGSWANQVRILSQSFQQLAAIVGGGLVAAFLPVIKVINSVITKIVQLASVVASFVGKAFNMKGAISGTGAGLADAAEAAGSVASNTDAAADGISGVGGAAKKSGKELNKFAASWHEVNEMTSNEDSGGGSGGAGGGLGDMPVLSDGNIKIGIDDEISPKLEKLKKRFEELKDLFLKGFRLGLGDTSVFGSIRENIAQIKKSFSNIFTDKDVGQAANDLINTLTENMGRRLGAFTSIGSSILDNITGGMALAIKGREGPIKEWLISMFNITGEIDTIKTDFLVAVSKVFSVLRGDAAKQVTADITQIFLDAFMGLSGLNARIERDVLGLILNPFTRNAEKIKTAFENTLKPLETWLGTLADSSRELWEKVLSMYDTHIKPMFDSFSEGISEIVGSLVDGYNNSMAPVLQNIADKFKEVYEGTVEPLLSDIIELVGAVADYVKARWEVVIQPIINWIAKNLFPLIAPVMEKIATNVLNTFSVIAKVFDAFILSAKAIVTYLTATFTGQWEGAWKTISEEFSKIWNLIPDAIKNPIETTANGIITFLNGAFSLNWKQAWEGLKNTFKGVWDLMPDVVKKPISSIIGFINTMISGVETGINGVIEALRAVNIEIPATPFTDAVNLGFGNLQKVSLPRVPFASLATGGVVTKETFARIGESGPEAIVPLARNTEWADAVATRMSQKLSPNLGNLQLKTEMPSIDPVLPYYDVGKVQDAMRMEMDEKMAAFGFENRQTRETLEEILEAVRNKKLIVGDRDIFEANRRETLRYGRRTNKDPYPVYGIS